VVGRLAKVYATRAGGSPECEVAGGTDGLEGADGIVEAQGVADDGGLGLGVEVFEVSEPSRP
jgi:hypothetical protein